LDLIVENRIHGIQFTATAIESDVIEHR